MLALRYALMLLHVTRCLILALRALWRRRYALRAFDGLLYDAMLALFDATSYAIPAPALISLVCYATPARSVALSAAQHALMRWRRQHAVLRQRACVIRRARRYATRYAGGVPRRCQRLRCYVMFTPIFAIDIAAALLYSFDACLRRRCASGDDKAARHYDA